MRSKAGAFGVWQEDIPTATPERERRMNGVDTKMRKEAAEKPKN
jgi:hypothetical protein